MWRLWCKALGQKEGRSNYEADRIAILRTVILASYLITNCFIIAGVIRHWTVSEVVITPPCHGGITGSNPVRSVGN